MIFADFMTELGIVVGLVVTVFMMLLFVVIAFIGMLARHIRNDYRKQGGAPALAKKMAGGIASRMLRQWIIGRFR